MVTLKNVITRLDPDSLPAQALEGEQGQLISVVKSLFPYCNAISNILFRTRMITASLDKAPRTEYATDDDSSKFRFRPNLVNKQQRRRYHHHHPPLQSKAPMDHALGFRTITRAGPPTKNKKMKRKNTTASTINKIDTQRNSKANRRLSNAITTSHNKEHHDKTKNKGIKRLRSRPSNRSRSSAGGKRKSSHSSNTSSKRPMMSFPNVALQFQKAIMQKMIQQKGLRQGSTSALFNILSSVTQQGAMSQKIVNPELQYTADPPRIFKALGYATAIATTSTISSSSAAATAAAAATIKTIQSMYTEKIPIALAPASASINLHRIARRTILPFLNIQQPSKEDTTRAADENETIFEDTTISKEQQQQQDVQPIRSTSSATAKNRQAEKFTRQKSVPRKRYPAVESESQFRIHKSHHHNVMKLPSRLGSVIAGFFGAGQIMRNIRTSSQILSSPSMTANSGNTTTTANPRVNSFELLLKPGFLPLHTLMASLPSVAAIVGGEEEATALDRAAHDKVRIVKSESSKEIGEPFLAKRTPESIKGEDGKVTSLPSNEIAFQLPTHNILSKMLSRIISNVARADDDRSTDAELLAPIFLHKGLFRNVMTSIEKISTRMAMPMQRQIASGVKGQAKEELDIEISQEPKQARVDDMVTGQAIERLLYDEYGKENIQSAAAAYTALRSRVNHPLHFPFQLMSSPTSIVTESVKRVLATSIRSIFQEQNTIIPSITLPSAVKDRFDVQKITINPYYYTRRMHGALESTTPIGLSSFPEPAAKNASQPDRRYLSHLYAKKEDEEDITRYEFENRNLESKEQQEQQLLVNPVTGLQREYSKYILHNAIYKAGKDQSILLTATRPSQSKPLLSTTKTTTGMRERQADVRNSSSSSSSSSSRYANMAKIDNSSINLPVVSQLQVMLANQYADNSDHHINSLALFPQRQILSSPIPQAFVAQRLGTSFESTAGKQMSTISTTETNGKMLNERSSSTLMRGSTESRFGQDNSSSSSRSAAKIEQEDTNKGFSLRQLRKMMEQIFHEELKRYGL